MWFVQYAPVLTISAIEKKRVTKVFPLIDAIMYERGKRIKTSDLNKAFREIALRMSLPLYKGKTAKLSYITQVNTQPPTFIFFTNYPAAFKDHHIRYLENILRNHFSFIGTPIRIYIKAKERVKK
jgi:GTP-binding protein